MSLENTRFVIIGASGGIGSGLSRRLKRLGAQPILLGRSTAKLALLGEELGASTQAVDASKADDLEQAVAAFGPIHGIVNCAGSILLKPAHLTTEAEWRQIIETNLTTAYAAVRAGAKALGSTGGSIVLLCHRCGSNGHSESRSNRSSQSGRHRINALGGGYLRTTNIRVNCVAPGLVDTPMTERIVSNPAAAKASSAMHPLGRMGQPEDVASGITWLLEPENNWVTGQILGIDGGLGTVRNR